MWQVGLVEPEAAVEDGTTGVCVVVSEDGQQVELPMDAVRLPLEEEATPPPEGAEVHALFGAWQPGVVTTEALAEPQTHSLGRLRHAGAQQVRRAQTQVLSVVRGG